MIRFLMIALVLLGAAHAQTLQPWVGIAKDGAPRPSTEEQACSKELNPVLQGTRKRFEEIRAASEQLTPSSATCKAVGRLVEAEGRLISLLQSRPECQRPFILDAIRTSYAKNMLVKERVCSAPERQRVGLHEILTAEPPTLPKNPLRF
jgi:hypothetical protein